MTSLKEKNNDQRSHNFSSDLMTLTNCKF